MENEIVKVLALNPKMKTAMGIGYTLHNTHYYTSRTINNVALNDNKPKVIAYKKLQFYHVRF